MAANFNNSAWFYDRLSRVVYGSALVSAQVYLLQYIQAGSTILIVGGGTGWLLEEITKVHSAGLNITYADVSERMIRLSKKRNTGSNEIVFMNDAIESISLAGKFDVAITPFLFDNFTEQTLQKVFGHINSLLEPDGLWLNTDFQLTGKWWQKALLKTMFLFFKALCNIEASALPDIERCFKEHNYKITAEKTFFGDFVISRVLKK